MDGYFDVMSEGDGGWMDNEGLLDGIVSSLHPAAIEAFNAVDTLYGFMGQDIYGGVMDSWKEKIRADFIEFSQADIELESREGLQGIIDSLGNVRQSLLEDSKSDLEHSHDMLQDWRGAAANDAKFYVRKLADEYELVATKISVLQSDVVAAREMVAKGRNDLINLSGTFLSAAEQYVRANAANERGASEVLASAFAGAVAGLLAVATAGVGAVAAGALIAGNVAGSMAVDGVKQQEVGGDEPPDIYKSFSDAVDDVKEGITRAVEKLVHDIGALEMPTLQDPPDVSPGKSFDPDAFGTDSLPEQTEKNVRDSGKDIPTAEEDRREKEKADENVSDVFS